MKTKIIFILILISLVAFTILLFISRGIPSQKETDEKLKVATTIFPLYDITRNITKDKVEVIQILPPGASPHTFEVTPSTVRELSGTQIVFTIGYGLDDWAENTIANIINAQIVTVDENISLKRINNDSIDPHYWLSITNAKIIAENITEQLKTRDNKNAAYYQANLISYIKMLNETKAILNTKVSKLSMKKLVTFHNAWQYFAEDFSLQIVTTFEPLPGKEPTPKYLAELQATIKKHNLNTIFSEPQLSNESIKPLVEDLGIRLAVLDPLGGVEGRDSFIKLMEYNVTVIVTN